MRLPCNIHKLRGVGVVVTVATKPIHCSSVSSRALSNQCHATMSNSHSYADVVCELATLMFTCITKTHRLKLRFAVSGSGMRYALYGKNGKACKRTRVIPYVRICDLSCGCEWLRMRQTESLHVSINVAKRYKIGWRKLGNP